MNDTGGVMNFSERLRAAMRLKGYTQGKLAKEVGMAQSSVNKLLNGASGSKKVVEIASVLNIKPEWLSHGVGKMQEITPTHSLSLSQDHRSNKEHEGAFRVEVLDISVSAGARTSLVSDFVEAVHAIEFSSDTARALFSNRSANIIKMITVSGDSMSPTLKAGDQVFVDVSVRNFETDGIYAFVFGSTFHIKRLQMQGLKLVVISDNPIYQNWFVTEDDEDQLLVIGKVLIHQSIQYNRVG